MGPDDHDGHDAGYDDGGGNHERILESELEFVHAVSAGGSVKFLPAL